MCNRKKETEESIEKRERKKKNEKNSNNSNKDSFYFYFFLKKKMYFVKKYIWKNLDYVVIFVLLSFRVAGFWKCSNKTQNPYRYALAL